MLHFTPNLQARGKWFKTRENLAVGDIVLIIDPYNIYIYIFCMMPFSQHLSVVVNCTPF